MSTHPHEFPVPLASPSREERIRFTLFPLLRSHEQARAAIDPALPAPLQKIVERVLDRTRLWPREKEDVARELSAHFAEGLEAGRSVERLAAEFGSPEMAAQLIRRAKIRNRPWAWHVARRGLQGTAIFLAGWTILAAAYFGDAPTISRDFIAEDDARTRKIPPDDRAWPLYRAGLEKLDRNGWNALRPVGKGPEHPNWPQVVKFLDANRPSLEFYVRGGKRKRLGYIYRDPANDGWLLGAYHAHSLECYSAVRCDWERPLPFAQDLRIYVGRVLSAAARDAVSRGRGKQAIEYWCARLGLAEQLWRDGHYDVIDVIACAEVREVSREILEALLNYADDLSNDDMKELARKLRAICDGRPRIRSDSLRRFIDDFLQRAYTNEGDGKGRFLPQGMGLLQALRKSETTAYAEEMIGPQGLPAGTEAVLSEVAGRREMRSKMIELADHIVAATAGPVWKRDLSRCKKDLETLRDTPELHCKYFPALVVLAIFGPAGAQFQRGEMVEVRTAVARDAALTMIAATLHKRRIGDWPARLEDLVPSLLPAVPKDPFDGRPLRYRVENRIPRLYSIGRNRKDDHGAPPAAGPAGWQAETGDWQLFPPLGDEE